MTSTHYHAAYIGRNELAVYEISGNDKQTLFIIPAIYLAWSDDTTFFSAHQEGLNYPSQHPLKKPIGSPF